MPNLIQRYTHWLHTKWPAGTVEKLPVVGENGATNLPEVRVVGDLSGIPLLKFSSETATRAVAAILAEPGFQAAKNAPNRDPNTIDLAIIGAGVAGVSAAIEAKKSGLNFALFEATAEFSTVANFPKGKPIYTYPTDMAISGGLQFPPEADVKERLLESMESQARSAGIEPVFERIEQIERKQGHLLLHRASGEPIRALRAIVAIGRSGNFRKLGVPGEELDKVTNRLHDPKDFAGKKVLVVGGGDSALEAAIALTACGAHVTLSYRKPEFARPKPDNLAQIETLTKDPSAPAGIEHPSQDRVTTAANSDMRGNAPAGSLRLVMESEVAEIQPGTVKLRIRKENREETIPNDAVFAMIGREAPLAFFRKSGVRIRGEWTARAVAACLAFLVFCVFLYHFKSNHPAEFPVQQYLAKQKAFPFNVPNAIDSLGGTISGWAKDSTSFLYTLKRGLGNPSFYYTLAYCTCVVVFGIRRIRRRNTPYVTRQTLVLMTVQCIPLFILPELILPWMGRNGFFEQGAALRGIADQLFETYDGGIGQERAYWRAYGFILAFPLNVYNVFTDHPMWTWLAISAVQTFVIIPLIIFRWGKGAYCGWICSCGALAETLGDKHRHKMPHGPFWNRLNMVGQGALAFAAIVLVLRIIGWMMGPESWAATWHHKLFEGIPFLNYAWSVDILMGGIFGVGLYFWFSGRVWCRFACPLAALMHIYARLSQYRIFPEKSKCISCNVCTSVCHQGIDVMNFANKGMPMEDPECVRCSACVQECPTGVLAFGRFDSNDKIILDKLPASRVRMAEKK